MTMCVCWLQDASDNVCVLMAAVDLVRNLVTTDREGECDACY